MGGEGIKWEGQKRIFGTWPKDNKKQFTYLIKWSPF